MSNDTFAEYRKQRRSDTDRGLLTKENGVILLFTVILAVVWWFAWPKYFPPKPGTAAVPVLAETGEAAPDPEAPYEPPEKFTIAFLDVGQGDAAVWFTPSGGIFLCDGGEGSPDNRDSRYTRATDAGNKVIIPFLRARNARELTAVFLTHPHSDHFGGLIDVIRELKARAFYNSGKAATSTGYRTLLRLVQNRHVDYVEPRPGEELALDDKLKMQVLAVNSEANNLNNASIVLKLTYGAVSFLLTGDAEKQVEEQLVATQAAALRSTVLKTGHHGSRTSSTASFVGAVNPRYAIISVGRNSFGHPNPDVLERLQGAGMTVLRTDECGTITFTTSGNINDLEVTTERQAGARAPATEEE